MFNKKRNACGILVSLTLIVVVFMAFTINEVYAANDYMYDYKTEWVGNWKTKKDTKWSFAGGQRAGGYRFDTGKGGFHWSESGGPTISVSIGASAGFASVSIGVSAGKKASTGEYVAIGDKKSYVKKHYYKLIVKPTIKYRHYKCYRRVKARYTRDGKPGKWELVAKMTKAKPFRMDLGTKVVGTV